jgi:hypothetical protein
MPCRQATFGRSTHELRRTLIAKGTGKSGVQRAEEHVQFLVAFLNRSKDKPLPRESGSVNKSAVARECGFRREVFRDNPRCRKLLEQADKEDSLRFLSRPPASQLSRNEGCKIDKERRDLEERVLILLVDKAKLERDLERYRRRDVLMAETGKLS